LGLADNEAALTRLRSFITLLEQSRNYLGTRGQPEAKNKVESQVQQQIPIIQRIADHVDPEIAVMLRQRDPHDYWAHTKALAAAQRLIEHQGHAEGHAALLIEEHGVLVAGDMLSDVLIPMLDFDDDTAPIEDYLAGLRLIEGIAGDVDVLVPGHGSIGGADQVRARIEQDRAYVLALRDGDVPADLRVGPSAKDGWDWVASVHERQLQQLARRREHEGSPG